MKRRLTLFSSLLTVIVLFGLIACGPSPFDEPPLHDAAKNGDIEQVQALLEDGVDVNSVNSEGATPLHWAAFKGRVDVAKLLISKGAKVNATTKKGSTPLRLATTHKREEMMRYLKSVGAIIE